MMCLPPAGEVSTGDVCTECPLGSFTFNASSECSQCPVGANCFGAQTLLRNALVEAVPPVTSLGPSCFACREALCCVER